MDALPETYPRRILLAVTGLSPQIVTESLYALAVERRPAFIPTEVHLITSQEGAERARLALLSDDPGWFSKLRNDYGLGPIEFGRGNIHILRRKDGTPMEDIRTPEDNECAADAITDLVRGLTADPCSALHVSIAGGRKTMGFYLGYALSLFGRPQDRLSHVLVSEPYESSWEFFYPTPHSRVITTRDNKLADTAEAQVTLAEIPFVSLRHGLPNRLLKGHGSFTEAVQAARDTLGPPTLVLEPPARRIQASGKTISLPPAELALLAVFARRAIEGEPPLAAPSKGSPDGPWAKRYLRELRLAVGTLADREATDRALAKGMDGDYFSTHLSKLRRLLKQALGNAATPYLIDDGGSRPRHYRLGLAPESVWFGDAETRPRQLKCVDDSP